MLPRAIYKDKITEVNITSVVPITLCETKHGVKIIQNDELIDFLPLSTMRVVRFIRQWNKEVKLILI